MRPQTVLSLAGLGSQVNQYILGSSPSTGTTTKVSVPFTYICALETPVTINGTKGFTFTENPLCPTLEGPGDLTRANGKFLSARDNKEFMLVLDGSVPLGIKGQDGSDLFTYIGWMEVPEGFEPIPEQDLKDPAKRKAYAEKWFEGNATMYSGSRPPSGESNEKEYKELIPVRYEMSGWPLVWHSDALSGDPRPKSDVITIKLSTDPMKNTTIMASSIPWKYGRQIYSVEHTDEGLSLKNEGQQLYFANLHEWPEPNGEKLSHDKDGNTDQSNDSLSEPVAGWFRITDSQASSG